MPEKQPLRGPAVFVASLLFLVGAITFIVGGLRLLGGDSMGGGLCLLASVLAFGFLLNALSRTTGSS
jgi:hypothetical protein